MYIYIYVYIYVYIYMYIYIYICIHIYMYINTIYILCFGLQSKGTGISFWSAGEFLTWGALLLCMRHNCTLLPGQGTLMSCGCRHDESHSHKTDLHLSPMVEMHGVLDEICSLKKAQNIWYTEIVWCPLLACCYLISWVSYLISLYFNFLTEKDVDNGVSSKKRARVTATTCSAQGQVTCKDSGAKSLRCSPPSPRKETMMSSETSGSVWWVKRC